MKLNYFIIPTCAALGVFVAGRLSLPPAPQAERSIVIPPSATPIPRASQSAIIRNGNDTLQVEGSASLMPPQPATQSRPHP